jgi:hypothetical protein
MAYTRSADGVTQKGKTKGKNLGDSGPTVALQHGGKGSKGGKDNTEPEDTATPQLTKLGQSFAAASKVVGGFTAVLDSVTGVLGSFANVGDSLEQAAAQIPLFGKSLGVVAAAAVKTTQAHNNKKRG